MYDRTSGACTTASVDPGPDFVLDAASCTSVPEAGGCPAAVGCDQCVALPGCVYADNSCQSQSSLASGTQFADSREQCATISARGCTIEGVTVSEGQSRCITDAALVTCDMNTLRTRYCSQEGGMPTHTCDRTRNECVAIDAAGDDRDGGTDDGEALTGCGTRRGCLSCIGDDGCAWDLETESCVVIVCVR